MLVKQQYSPVVNTTVGPPRDKQVYMILDGSSVLNSKRGTFVCETPNTEHGTNQRLENIKLLGKLDNVRDSRFYGLVGKSEHKCIFRFNFGPN